MVEIWHPITAFDGYSKSNIGRVRNDDTNHILQPWLVHGHHRIELCNHGRPTRCYAHRLVVQEFIGPIPEGMQCDHIDHNRINNHVENLRIVTPSENNRNLTQYRGRRVHYFDGLPHGSEPITEVRGRSIAPGYYGQSPMGMQRQYFVEVAGMYRRLTNTPHGPHGWKVTVTSPTGERISISWHE
jgi:hypothetical protein